VSGPRASRSAPEATLDAIGASGFFMQAERDVSQEALGWFQRIIGAAPQGPNHSVVMGPRMAVMAPNLARSVREGSLGLLIGCARAILRSKAERMALPTGSSGAKDKYDAAPELSKRRTPLHFGSVAFLVAGGGFEPPTFGL
jgi:hypothetical protein